MLKKFKKRFKNIYKMRNWINREITYEQVDAFTVNYHITKSMSGKKIYHHLDGSYNTKDVG